MIYDIVLQDTVCRDAGTGYCTVGYKYRILYCRILNCRILLQDTVLHDTVLSDTNAGYCTAGLCTIWYWKIILYCMMMYWRILTQDSELEDIVSVLWRKEGYTVKYSLSTRENLRAELEGFPDGSGYISPYIPTWVIIQTFSITKHHTSSIILPSSAIFEELILRLAAGAIFFPYCLVDEAIRSV